MKYPTITIALPDTMVSDVKHLRDKSIRLGQIARTLAIFKISELLIYRSPYIDSEESARERRIIKNILGYIECPQYLRKSLIPVHRDLEFAGILPPLATPHHQLDEKLKLNQFREAAIFLGNNNAVQAEVGIRHPISVINPPPESLKERIVRKTIQIVQDPESKKFLAEVVPRELVEEKIYWGFKIRFTDTDISKFINRRENTFIIATDRDGRNYQELIKENDPKQTTRIPKNKNLLILFGEPRHGLYEMLKGNEKVALRDIADLVINTIPTPGTRSIRLEEALIISLARLLPIYGIE